jgi:GDPmannose 4,6-dehydratase
MKRTAIITGMTGQDGPYLARFLLERDYHVYGLVKRYSNPNLDNLAWLGIDQDVELLTGDITDDSMINNLVRTIKPQEFYNLAAQSFVGASWELNKLTTEVNAMGPLNILNAIKMHSSNTRFYQASTSEMYGNSDGNRQSESTPFHPRSPYGVSKLYGHWITVNYRESYGLYACSGILFNHESPLRGREFVTRKVTDAVARIKLGMADSVTLGNLDARRDWGFAGDFVEAMYLMLQQPEASDYVISTGEQHTIGDLCRTAFEHVGISDWHALIRSDPRFKRPAELHSLCGDSSRARKLLNWQPKVDFQTMIRDMVDADLARLQPRQ